MRNKKTIITIIAILAIGSLFFWRFKERAGSQNADQGETAKAPVPVSIQTVSESRNIPFMGEYPAIVSADQEITLVARASGTVTELGFDLGDWVTSGERLLTIDDSGNFSRTGENDLKSSTIQQLEIALEKAEESYKLAKRNYEDDDSYANKKAKEIAKLERERAQIDLEGALDSRFISAPISGFVIERSVSLGDSVSVGQTLAKLSQTGNIKVRFFVDQEELESLKTGMMINIIGNNQTIPAKIANVSPQADPTTRRFLVEAKPESQIGLRIGSITGVSFQKDRSVEGKDWLILPLSAITVSQSENYIFINKNGSAEKVPVEIKKISGETAQVSASLQEDAQIVIEGNKLIKAGDPLNVK